MGLLVLGGHKDWLVGERAAGNMISAPVRTYGMYLQRWRTEQAPSATPHLELVPPPGRVFPTLSALQVAFGMHLWCTRVRSLGLRTGGCPQGTLAPKVRCIGGDARAVVARESSRPAAKQVVMLGDRWRWSPPLVKEVRKMATEAPYVGSWGP